MICGLKRNRNIGYFLYVIVWCTCLCLTFNIYYITTQTIFKSRSTLYKTLWLYFSHEDNSIGNKSVKGFLDSRFRGNDMVKAPILRQIPLRNFSMAAAIYSPNYPKAGTGIGVSIPADYNLDAFNTFCTNSPGIVAVIPIISKPDNFQRRTALRNTLGTACEAFKCKIFFIIGTSLKADVNRKLKTEYGSKKDVIMIPKLDTYRDLNNKIAWMLNWIWKYCQEPKYVVRIIDDVHLNLHNLFPQLEAIQSDRYMFGQIVKYGPIRDKSSKFYISETEWPFVTFPPYLLGTVIAFPTHIVPELRRNIYSAPYCWVEDVWFGGLVPFMTSIPLIQTKIEHKYGKVSLDRVNDYLYVHGVSLRNQYKYYKASKMSKLRKIKT